ncbi:MAG: FIST C-terminal domain-containing protein [Magnetococcales bacterium]|nr:FIST C-terminal domain-containing protein [Magnetococcales bacterium]
MKVSQKIFKDGVITAGGLAPLAALEPQLVLVFGSESVFAEESMFPRLREAFPTALLAGCSTAGEIAGARVYDGSCVVTVTHFSRVGVRQARGSVSGMEESEAAGGSIGSQLRAPDLKGVLLFSKGVGVNGSSVIQGIISQIGADIPVTGGLAGDGGAFRRTLVLDDRGVSENGVVGIGLYGESLRLGHGSYGGWEPFGPARRVTRCEGNLLFELDGEPALNVYKSYLGEYAKDLPASGLLFPFEMLSRDQSRLGLIRTILGVDETQGSLILAGDIDTNGYLRLMHASTDALVNGAEAAAQASRRMVEDAGPGLALLVSCVGRKLVMGDNVDEEVEVVADSFAPGTVTTGFYSYGEISPFSTTTDCKLHNQTMTITFLNEED